MNNIKGLLSVLSSILIVGLASHGNAGTLFQESFEDGNFSARGWYDTTTEPVVNGGQKGNCMQWAWASGAVYPTNVNTMRHLFTPTETLYVSFYLKFQTGWRGSGLTYQPHMVSVLSNLDSSYAGLSNSYLNTYYEMHSDTSSPYAIRPYAQLQDSMNVNTSYGTPPIDLSKTTENRSVGRCNSPIAPGAVGTCYNAPPWYSAQEYNDPTHSVTTNAWHKIELYYKMNTIVGGIGQANGIMQTWIDGVQTQNRGDVTYRTGKNPSMMFTQFDFGPYMGSGSPIAQTMWVDELLVATDIPTSALPAPPQNLRIISAP